jgi:hypothetical protein
MQQSGDLCKEKKAIVLHFHGGRPQNLDNRDLDRMLRESKTT